MSGPIFAPKFDGSDLDIDMPQTFDQVLVPQIRILSDLTRSNGTKFGQEAICNTLETTLLGHQRQLIKAVKIDPPDVRKLSQKRSMQIQNTPIIRRLRRQLHDLMALEVPKRQLLQGVSSVFWQAILRNRARHGDEGATHNVHGGQ